MVLKTKSSLSITPSTVVTEGTPSSTNTQCSFHHNSNTQVLPFTKVWRGARVTK